MGSARAKQIESNRHYLKTIAEVLLLCSKQDLEIRGHKESLQSEIPLNRGNFLEILDVIANHDDAVHHRVTDGPGNATYLSADIQNELLNVMGDLVRKKKCSDAQKAGLYSVLADETRDCSRKEQLAIVLRYVNAENRHSFRTLSDLCASYIIERRRSFYLHN